MSTELVTEEQASPEESPTRYMLPEQVQADDESGLISYKYGNLSPAKYPFDPSEKKKKKRKSSAQNKEPKKKKPKTGKTVHFHSKVIIKTIHGKKSDLTEIELSHEEEYYKRHSDFVVKRTRQKQWMKLHHQQRPMTPKRMNIQTTIQRENGNA